MAVLSVSWNRVAVFSVITVVTILSLLYLISPSTPSPKTIIQPPAPIKLTADNKPIAQSPEPEADFEAIQQQVHNEHWQKVIDQVAPKAAAAPRKGGGVKAEDKKGENQDDMICFHVAGFTSCPYFQRSKSLANKLHQKLPEKIGEPVIVSYDRDVWDVKKLELAKVIHGAQNHHTSPLVWEGCTPDQWAYIGGNDDFTDNAWSRFKITDSN
ncbi:hypothetical protein BC829DRAFT_398983 [Chytridium lagenaria]|nr:hypothetical protein BC829DRAFT_398983 [Chytridium lagenaria]